jgi:hypothetical protein
MKIMKYFVLSISLLSASANAGLINLVENGSFEENFDQNNPVNIALSQNLGGPATLLDVDGIAGGEEWGIFLNLPGWSTINAAGIEVQYSGVGGRNASDGSRFLELDTHPTLNGGFSNGGIFQDIAGLIIGQEYNLSFDFMGRSTTANSNNLTVSFGSTSTLFAGFPQSFDWSAWNFKYTATSTTMRLQFKGEGAEDGKGALLDNVSLMAVEVPEPSMFALMLLGLGGLLLRKRN